MAEVVVMDEHRPGGASYARAMAATDLSDWLETSLPALLDKYGVPGAAVAAYAHGDVVERAAGVLNTATGVAATTDSLFQIGSVTKVWTATLVMQLVEEGLLDLDEPIRTYLPEFRLADESAASVITMRQLLSHTAGFEGDIFTDTGRGDDCVEKYVATLSTDGQLFPPGERFSYNNAGFCVIGRVIEVLRGGKSYDQCLAEHIFAPLGLQHAAAGPYEAILQRAAVGHIQLAADAPLTPAPVWSLARSNGPAGSQLAMSAGDLITFARTHLAGGVAPNGTRLVSADSAAAMQREHVRLPELTMMGEAWGLGWEMSDLGDTRVIGHDGSTIGQASFLRIVPGQDVAVALLTNGGDVIGLYREVLGHLLRELAGAGLEPMPTPPDSPEPVDATRFVGTYSSDISDLIVTQDDDGRVWMEQIPKGLLAELGGQRERTELVSYRGDTLIVAEPSHGMHTLTAFVGDDGTGRALYLHTGRATRRAD